MLVPSGHLCVTYVSTFIFIPSGTKVSKAPDFIPKFLSLVPTWEISSVRVFDYEAEGQRPFLFCLFQDVSGNLDEMANGKDLKHKSIRAGAGKAI